MNKQTRNAHPISVLSPGFLPFVRLIIESPTSMAQLVALPTKITFTLFSVQAVSRMVTCKSSGWMILVQIQIQPFLVV